MKRLLILICLLVLASGGISTSHAGNSADNFWNVAFENTTDQKVVYLFYWVDHPFDYSLPANLAGGELDPGEYHQVEYDYLFGEYFVIWSVGNEKHRFDFTHDETMERLRVLTP